jgi:hypothetical protein
MYEMQGPGPVFGRWPAGCPAGVLVNRPSAGTGYPREVPVSRFFPRSGVAPGVVPVSGSDVFLLPGTPVAQGFPGTNFKILSLSTKCPQRRPCCPPEVALFHRAIHSFRTGDAWPTSHSPAPAARGPCRPEPAEDRSRCWPEPAQDRPAQDAFRALADAAGWLPCSPPHRPVRSSASPPHRPCALSFLPRRRQPASPSARWSVNDTFTSRSVKIIFTT